MASVKLQYQMSGGWWSEIRIACGGRHVGITGKQFCSEDNVCDNNNIFTNALHTLPIGLVHPIAISKAAVPDAHTRDPIPPTVIRSVVITYGT